MKTLKMKFETGGNKTFVLSLNHCRGDLVKTEVESAMKAIRDAAPFGILLTGLLGAEIVDRSVTKIL